MLSLCGTKHPVRRIQDLADVIMGEDLCSFWCIFKDPLEANKRKEYHFEAMTNHQAAEVVAKLQHLMRISCCHHSSAQDSRLSANQQNKKTSNLLCLTESVVGAGAGGRVRSARTSF